MHKVQVQIKSMPFTPRTGSEFRAGSIQVVDSDLAKDLEQAGIATVLQDPFVEPVVNEIPYLQPEMPAVTDDTSASPNVEKSEEELAAEKLAAEEAELAAMLAAEEAAKSEEELAAEKLAAEEAELAAMLAAEEAAKKEELEKDGE